jgi:putative FmdB family regulatory protein
MPRYTYHCEQCDEYIEACHGITERPDLRCDCTATLERVPSMPLSLRPKGAITKSGELVRSSIKEFKEDLKRQRTAASKREV